MQSIGIDFGTSNTVAAVWTGDEAEVITGKGGIPSLVSFEGSGRFIGEAAKSKLASNPENTLFGFNRLLGRNERYKFDAEIMPYETVVENDCCKISVMYKGKPRSFAPEEIAAMLISHVREIASNDQRKGTVYAAIAIPSMFTNAQRRAIKKACGIAKIKVLGLIHENTAAAIAYGFGKTPQMQKRRVIMVINLGGGHLDVSVLAIHKKQFQVILTVGDVQVGGQNFTENMVDEFIRQFEKDHKLHTRIVKHNEKVNVATLRMKCDEAKKKMSRMTATQVKKICIPDFADAKILNGEIARGRFDEINQNLFQKVIDTVEKAKTDADEAIQEVVLVGGSTRIPAIREKLIEVFKHDNVSILTDLNAVETVAQGAAIYAASISGSRFNENLCVDEIISRKITVKYNMDSGCGAEIQLEPNDRIPFRRMLPVGNNPLPTSVYEGDNKVLFRRIDRSRSQLELKIDQDGILEIAYHGRRQIPKHADIEHELGIWRENTKQLSELQSLALEVKDLIPNSSPERNDDMEKCSALENWARERMNDDVQGNGIRKEISKNKTSLRKLKLRYQKDVTRRPEATGKCCFWL